VLKHVAHRRIPDLRDQKQGKKLFAVLPKDLGRRKCGDRRTLSES